MKFKQRRHNTPVATLLRNFMNKQSGKVVDSRKEIQWRFDCLDWKDQKKILFAFLASGKSDREWAAKKLTVFWDPCFEKVVSDLWEQTGDDILAWPITRYFPTDYLKANSDRLGTGRNYHTLCLRLAYEKDFEIDRSRLMETDLLDVYLKSARTLSGEEATDILFSIVHKLCTDGYQTFAMNNSWPHNVEKGYRASIFGNKVMRHAVNILLALGLHDTLNDFYCWHLDVCMDLLNSDEFARLFAGEMEFPVYHELRLALTKRYYYEHLPSKYKPEGEEPAFEPEFNCTERTISVRKGWRSPYYYAVDKVELQRFEKYKLAALDRQKDVFYFLVFPYFDTIVQKKDVTEPIDHEKAEKALAIIRSGNPVASKLIDRFGLEVPEEE